MRRTRVWTCALVGLSLAVAACLCTNALPTTLLGGADEEEESVPTPAEEEGTPSDEAEPEGEEGDEGEEVEPAPDPELPTSVSDDTLGLSMNLPEGWLTISGFGMLTASGDPAMIASIAAGGDPPEPTSPFLVATALPTADPQMTGTQMLDAMTDELLTSLQVGQANSPFTITGQHDLTVDDNPARSFEITGSDPEFGTELDGRVVVIAGPKQVCAILGVAPAALWSAFDATFDHIIASMEFFEPNPDAGPGGLEDLDIPAGKGEIGDEEATFTGNIELLETMSGTMEDGGVHDWKFQGMAGQRVAVEVQPATDDLDAVLFLYGPDGSLLQEVDDGFSGEVEVIIQSLPDDGIYTARITPFGFGGGAYTILIKVEVVLVD